ncbi:MAG TPA: hypothetical protein VNL94_10195 [Candidatus Binatia bacterium]|nr:hypothetical protein [Candidatus Binatia bacterium]
MGLGGAIRQSLVDFYFNSWRLAPANVAWGVLLILALLAPLTSAVGLGLLVLLAIPTAGIYRMAALIARDEPAAFSDFVAGMRRYAGTAVLLGVGVTLLVFVLTTNVLLGMGTDHPVGWFVSAMALWGLVGLAMFLVAAWPLLVDPRREDVGVKRRLSLAAIAVIGRPVRMVVLVALVGLLLVASAVLFALLVMVTVAFVALVSSRYVLPMVDELEARLPEARRAP